MAWVSYDPFRTRDFPNTLQLKPEYFYRDIDQVRSADLVLFPERWQVNALVFGLGACIFPSHASYLLGYDKIEMYRAFRAIAPRAVPETMIRANTDADSDEIWQAMNLPFVAKLPRSAEGRGVWLIEDRDGWRAYRARTEVLYVQELLPIDRDVRVVVIGGEIIAGYWRIQRDGFHNNIAQGGEVDYSPVPDVVLDTVRAVSNTLGIDHAGFDVALVGDQPYLLEFNRLFGNRGIPGGDMYLRESIMRHLLGKVPRAA